MRNEKENIQPPRWAQRFLAWYCRPSLLEDLEGDLLEYFERNVQSKGKFKARLIYVIDVLKFLRLYTVRKPEFLILLIQWVMVRSYVTTSGRNIVRNKLFSFINIFGLALSMSVALLMIAMIKDATSYDKFHEKYDRIYRLESQATFNGKPDSDPFASSSLRAGTLIRESVPGVEDITILRGHLNGDITFGETTVPVAGFWADKSFFKVFSFQILKGNPATALKEPFSILLTEQSAKKVFGDTDPLGKVVRLKDDRDYTVTAVIEDIPKFSHIKFDMLVSLSTRDVTEKDNEEEFRWSNMWSHYVYLTVPEGVDIRSIQAGLNKIAVQENKNVENLSIALSLQPLGAIVTGENHSNQVGPILGKTTLWILGSLSLVVVLSACFNYTNLSVARAFRRSREIGVRKTVGALKSHVVFQFVVESVIISLLALVFAFGLFLVIRPHFISIEHSLQQLLVLEISFSLVVLFIMFAITVGILAGIFPALFFAKINAIQVLKSLTMMPALKGVRLRKILLVVQYSLSIIAITATLVLYKQYSHFIAYDLGFTTENVLNVNLQGTKPEILRKELEQLPEVKAISQSLMITSIGSYWGTMAYNPNDPLDSTRVFYNSVNEEYIPFHGHKLIAGRNFIAKATDSVETEIIVNQYFLKRFNIHPDEPSKAIGQLVKVNGKDLMIIGVLENFEFGRANNSTGKEFLLRYANQATQWLNLKVQSEDWLQTHAKIESIWREIDPVHPLEAKFYTEQIEEAFAGLRAAVKLGGFLAVLVIVIASIGLLGMVVFTTEVRIKEISVRKVLGASEHGLLILLSKSFLILLVIATAVAVPITYLFFSNVLLPQIANHAPLGVVEWVIGVGCVALLALIMISAQTMKVARTNPAEVLKVE